MDYEQVSQSVRQLARAGAASLNHVVLVLLPALTTKLYVSLCVFCMCSACWQRSVSACLPFCVAGVCIEGNDIQPESGSIVAGVLEAQNIRLYCDLRNEQGDRLIVNWFIQSRQSRENGMDPGSIRADDDRFIQSGDNVSPDVNTSLNTNLTILSLTDDLDKAIIICGFDRPVANFTLRIYRKCNCYMYMYMYIYVDSVCTVEMQVLATV